MLALLDPLLMPLAAGEVDIVKDLVVVIAGAGLLALGLRRFGLAAIPAFLLAGACLGPHALSLVPAPERLEGISHLAVVILLFGIGLELHTSSMRGGALRLVGAAALALLFTIAFGYLASRILGLDPARACVVAMALSLSSTALVLKHLAERRELTHPAGRLAIAVLVAQDLAVVAMLAVLPLLARGAGLPAETGQGFAGVLDVLLRIGVVAVAVAASRYVMAPVLRMALVRGEAELLLLVGMAYALALAWLTYALGFSLEMGAFLAGFALSGTAFRHQLAGQLAPIRDLFLAVFFTTLGMQLEPRVLAASWDVVLGGTAALLVGKSVLIAGAAWCAGFSAPVAVRAGLALGQAGEFTLVLLGAATGFGLVDPSLGTQLIAIVVASLVLTPPWAALGRALARRTSTFPAAPWIPGYALASGDPDACAAESRVIIVGFGPVGEGLATALETRGTPYVIIELNPDTVARLRARGRPAVLGDVRNPAVLEHARLADAQALVLTIPDAEAAAQAISVARSMRPRIPILARVPLDRDRRGIALSGADVVHVDELASAVTLVDVVLQSLPEVSEATSD